MNVPLSGWWRERKSHESIRHEKIDILKEWYRKAYLGSDFYPGLFRELQAPAAGLESR